MDTISHIAYYRVSTQRQGESGLGLEAQQESVKRYIHRIKGHIIKEFIDVESATKINHSKDRAVLEECLQLCKKYKATLVIARIDRLARNLHLITTIMESKVKFVCSDMPEANQFTIHIMGAFAQYESELISKRTSEAMKAKFKREGRTPYFNRIANIAKRYYSQRKRRRHIIIMPALCKEKIRNPKMTYRKAAMWLDEYYPCREGWTNNMVSSMVKTFNSRSTCKKCGGPRPEYGSYKTENQYQAGIKNKWCVNCVREYKAVKPRKKRRKKNYRFYKDAIKS